MVSTSVLALSANDIRQAAPADALISWMREAMALTSRGDAVLPLRRGVNLPGNKGALGMMPGYVGGGIDSAGVKLVSLVPLQRRRGSSHLGMMILFDGDGLAPIAIMCGATITAIRTAAVSAVATTELARKDSTTLAILGCGEQAAEHARILANVRPFSELRVWGRNYESAQAFSESIAAVIDLPVLAYDDVRSTVAGADVVCTVTSAKEPFLFGDMVDDGTHINLVGSSDRFSCEVDVGLVSKSRFFVDYRPSTLDQAAEFLSAMEQGLVDENAIAAELGEVTAGRKNGRTCELEVTAYKSVGVASQDIVTAKYVYDYAVENRLGTRVSI